MGSRRRRSEGAGVPGPVTLSDILPYAFVVLTLLVVLIIHLPWLPPKVQAAGHQFTNLIGQEHRWTMFAPDPLGTSVYLSADLEHIDGSTSNWTIESMSGGEFRLYRWVKWSETVVLEHRIDQLEGLSEFLNNQYESSLEAIVIRGRQRFRPDPGGPRVVVRSPVLYEWSALDR